MNQSPQKSILITGCSSGIGLDVANTLFSRGWRVFATCKKQTDVERLEKLGLNSIRLDYTDESSIKDAVAKILLQTDNKLDALFNNGAYAIPGAIEDIPVDAFRAIFETNFFGWHTLVKEILPVMRSQGYGRILQCSSILGFTTLAFRGAYNSTKWAIEGYSDTLRLELEGSGIHVISIRPGPIRTKIKENSIPHFEKWVIWKTSALSHFYEATVIPRLYQSVGKDQFELETSAVTPKVIQALESKRPKLVYSVTIPTHFMNWAVRLLSKKMLHRLLSYPNPVNISKTTS